MKHLILLVLGLVLLYGCENVPGNKDIGICDLVGEWRYEDALFVDILVFRDNGTFLFIWTWYDFLTEEDEGIYIVKNGAVELSYTSGWMAGEVETIQYWTDGECLDMFWYGVGEGLNYRKQNNDTRRER